MSENNPKISIIIPIYNVEKYIDNCLSSLTNQTLKELEFICIDDGSTDNSYAILEKYAANDKRFVLIRQENKGQGNARNKGLEIAKGDYIGFVDSDDWVDLDYFEKLYMNAQKYNSDIAVASVLKHKKKYQKYNVYYKKIRYSDKLQERIKLCCDNKKNFFNCWNKLCKASVIKNNNIRFPEGMILEDVLFAIKILFYANKVVTVPNIKYHYVQNPNSTINSKDNKAKQKIDYEKAYTDLIEFAKENNIKLPERCNYVKSYKKMGIFKIYKGPYQIKYTLLGIIPLFKKSLEIKKVKILHFTNNRIILNIFGVKFSFLKKTSVSERENYSKFYNSFSSAKDIPKADGALRLFQEATLQLLIEFKELCNENDLTFWLDYGTLLGAVRHKGYIPWDDDVDISMMRDDYEKLIAIFENKTHNFQNLDLVICSNGKNRCFIKLISKKCKKIFIDIFPYDYYHKSLNDTEKKNLSNLITRINTFNKFSFHKNISKTRLKLKNDTKNFILKNKIADKINKPAIFMGVDFPHGCINRVYDYETIFPLKEIVFENTNFLAPNVDKKVLTNLYGNYQIIPKNVYPRHIACCNMTEEEIASLKNYINNRRNHYEIE